MPKALTIKSNAVEFAKAIKKRHGAMARVGADAVNTGARYVERKYKKRLDKFTLRNKFTKNAVRILKSKPQSSSGDFRPIADINAVVYVPKMKGGKEHYLKSQEVGDTKRGRSNTRGKVPKPLLSARISDTKNRPIKGPLKLQKAKINVLRVGGVPLGLSGSRFNTRQSWAILHKYTNTAEVQQGKKTANSRARRKYGWNMVQQFFFTGIRKGLGVFKKTDDKFTMTRKLDDSKVKVKALHKFQKSFDELSPKVMDTMFKRSAQKYLRK